jgi:glucose-1-phosphate adenylyltransferase
MMAEALLDEGPRVAVERRAPPAERLARLTWGVVLAGGRGERLGPLTECRAKPALPFGGALRVVDFAISNCLNSGLGRISVLTQYRAQDLIRHLARVARDLEPGRLDIVPAQQKCGPGWYAGTADAVYQNLDQLEASECRYVLVLAGDHAYAMDYRRMLDEHARSGAAATIACVEVPREHARCFGVLRVEADGRVSAFEEKPERPAGVPGREHLALASMGIYVFDAATLAAELRLDAADPASSHDFGRDLLPRLLARGRVRVHRFADGCVRAPGMPAYWRDVGTIDAYWQAHMDLVRPLPALDLYDLGWPIRGAPEHAPPARFVFDDRDRRGEAIDALVGAGCIVSGASVRRSVLFSHARAGDGSLVESSLLLPRAVVGRDSIVRRAIVDEGCVLPDGIRIGVDPAHDAARFELSPGGVVVVTARMLAAAYPDRSH